MVGSKHYKGIPTRRKVVVDAKGTLRPLNKIDPIAGVGFGTDFLNINKRPTLETRIIYARPTGDDANGDGTLERPYRTFVRAVQDLPVFADNTIWYIDITDIGVEILTEKFYMPSFISSFSSRLTLANPVYVQYIVEAALNIVAIPTVLETFTPTGTATNSTTGMRSYTDTSQSWSIDEHKGKFIIGASITEIGMIYSNTSDTIFTTQFANMTSPLSIAEPSATLSYGPSSDTFSEGAFAIQGVVAPITFGGIKFDKNDGASGQTVVATVRNEINFVLCDFAGVNYLYGSGNIVSDACYFKGRFGQDGVGVTTRYALFDTVSFEAHGDGGFGLDFWFSNRFENMTKALGHGGNNEAEIAYHYRDCSIDGNSTYGFLFKGGNRCRIEDCEIDNCSSSAILADGPGLLHVDGTKGATNIGYGVEVTNGSQVQIDVGTTVAGTINDVKVGVLTAETWASFRTGFPADVDLTTVSGTLARVFQP